MQTFFFQEKVHWVSTTTTLAPVPINITHADTENILKIGSRSITGGNAITVQDPKHDVNNSTVNNEIPKKKELPPKKTDTNESHKVNSDPVDRNVLKEHKM